MPSQQHRAPSVTVHFNMCERTMVERANGHRHVDIRILRQRFQPIALRLGLGTTYQVILNAQDESFARCRINAEDIIASAREMGEPSSPYPKMRQLTSCMESHRCTTRR